MPVDDQKLKKQTILPHLCFLSHEQNATNHSEKDDPSVHFADLVS